MYECAAYNLLLLLTITESFMPLFRIETQIAPCSLAGVARALLARRMAS